MKAVRGLLAASLLAGSALSAHGAIITENWESEVTSLDNFSTLAIGDVINWSITYDDTSTRYTTTYDDGRADLTYCTASDSDQASCTITASSVSLYADAISYDMSGFDSALDSLVNAHSGSYRTIFTNDSNTSARVENASTGYDLAIFNTDDYTSHLSNDDNGTFTAYWVTGDGFFTLSSLTLESRIVSTNTVPQGPVTSVSEPATAALLSIGLLGLGVVRRKRS